MASVLGSNRQRGRGGSLGRPHDLAVATLALVLVASFAVACTTVAPDLTPQPVELTGPFPDDYLDVIRRWIGDEFYDVSKVTNLQVSSPVAGHAQRWPSSKRLNGWYARVSFKAKDSIGASKGRLAYGVLLRDNSVISYRKLLY